MNQPIKNLGLVLRKYFAAAFLRIHCMGHYSYEKAPWGKTKKGAGQVSL